MPKVIRHYPIDNIPFITVMATIASAVIAFLAATVFFLFQAPQGPDDPLESGFSASPRAVTSSCGAASDIQRCCNDWAAANQIMTPQCVGEWQIQTDGSCGWSCTLE